jgi:predicted nucleic acid-binding protein
VRTTVRARVKAGMLELLENIDLPEDAEVTVTILDEPSTRGREAFRRAAGGWKDTVLGLDETIVTIFGRERGRLRAAGTLIGDFDLLVAATALHQNLTLLINNRSHFERIDGLRMESI